MKRVCILCASISDICAMDISVIIHKHEGNSLDKLLKFLMLLKYDTYEVTLFRLSISNHAVVVRSPLANKLSK